VVVVVVGSVFSFSYRRPDRSFRRLQVHHVPL